MAKKEVLKIEASLDTSKLKGQTRQATSEIKQQTSQIKTEANSVSKAVDGIGNAASKSASQMQKITAETKKANQEAKNLEGSLGRLNQSMSQNKNTFGNRSAIGFAAAGIALIGNQMSQSENDNVSMAGSALTGAASGAMAGSVFGPWGMAIGGLIGAGASLLTASSELKKSAQALIDASNDRYKNTLSNVEQRQSEEVFRDVVKGYQDRIANKETRNVATDWLGKDIGTYQDQIKSADDEIERLRKLNEENRSKIGTVTRTDELKWISDRSLEGGHYQKFTVSSVYSEKDFAKEQEEIAKQIDAQEKLRNISKQRLEIFKDLLDKSQQLTKNDAIQAAREDIKDKIGIQEGLLEFNRANQADVKNEISENKSQEDKLVSDYDKITGKLADSLTKIGGTSGYGAQKKDLGSQMGETQNQLKLTREALVNKLGNLETVESEILTAIKDLKNTDPTMVSIME